MDEVRLGFFEGWLSCASRRIGRPQGFPSLFAISKRMPRLLSAHYCSSVHISIRAIMNKLAVLVVLLAFVASAFASP